MKKVFACFALLLVMRLGAAEFDFPAKGPYFLIDDRVVEDRWMVERFVATLQRHPGNPVMRAEFPWEGTGPHLGGSVLRDPDDGLFKMWYSVWDADAYYNKKPFCYNVCYAESKDGLKWEKPNTGMFNYKGNPENNCIKLGRNKTQNIDVELNPAAGIFGPKFVAIHNDSGGIFVSTSGDGKRFDCTFAKPTISYHSDTHNNLVYDEVRRRWLIFLRPRAYAGARIKHVGRRRVAMQESPDLLQWTREQTVLVPEEGDAEYFYGMPVFRRGDLFFGTLQRYETQQHHIDCELTWSTDGYRWQRLPNAAQKLIMPRGEDGSWDAGMVFVSDKPVVVGDELWFYYGGSDTPHNVHGTYAIGVAITRRDRLIGVRSLGGNQSRILTRPFQVTGDLFLNAVVKDEIRVQVTSVADKIIWNAPDCTPVTGDGLELPVRWGEKTLGDLAGQTVRLRFFLRDAEIYTFELKKQ